jgi:nitrite reductase/ring-hydroxylating ferredoxin subunit
MLLPRGCSLLAFSEVFVLLVFLTALVINVEGELFAIENRCPHMGYPLFFGSLEGDVLTCGFHSAKFNVRTGKSLGPVTSERLKTFPVKIQNSSIFIEV